MLVGSVRSSGRVDVTVAGHREHEGAVDDEARGDRSEHVGAQGLALEGFECLAEAAGLARVGLVGG